MHRTAIATLVVGVFISTVCAQSTVLQDGASGGGAARTLATTIHPGPGDGTTTESTTLSLGQARSLVAFPFLIGSGAGQVPLGANVSSATLELYVLDVPGLAASRQLRASPITDFAVNGPWHEPRDPVQGGQGVGVSWGQRDARAGSPIAWLAQGGESYRPLPFAANVSVARGQGFWVSLDVTTAVLAHAAGLSNQGFLLESNQAGLDMVLASDDHADPSLRPRLSVSWSGTGVPINRIVEMRDQQLVTVEATPLLVPFPLRDQDGQRLHFHLREGPSNGTLQGSGWFSYRPTPGFIGTDRFSFHADDGFSTTPLIEVTIDVRAAAGIQSSTITGPGSLISTTVAIDNSAAGQVSNEGPELRVDAGQWAAFLGLPQLIGTTGIPMGSTILSAELAMTVSGGSATDARLQLTPLRDPGGLGQWVEPQGSGLQTDAGASWLYRDARPGRLVPWLVPGGEGDLDRASSVSSASPVSGTILRFDVTAAVQALALGATSSGLRLESLVNGQLLLASESHPNASWRPTLTVNWSGTLSGPSVASPVAVAGPDRTVVTGDSVTLDGSASYQPRAARPDLLWTQTAGPAIPIADPLAPVLTFTAPAVVADTLITINLAATDGTLVGLDDVNILVLAAPPSPNRPPLAEAGANQIVREGDYVLVDATASSDPEGQPLTYTWEEVGASNLTFVPIPGTGRTLFRAPATQGTVVTHFLRVTVDDGTHQAHDWISVAVHPSANQPPSVQVVPNLVARSEGWIGLDARDSSDPDPFATLTFSWRQIGGPATTLFRSATPMPYLKAPAVTQIENLAFEVRVSDGLDVAVATTNIEVHPQAPTFLGTGLSLAPYRDTISADEALHLMRRAGYAASPDDVVNIVGQGLSATLDQLFNPTLEPGVETAAWSTLPAPEGQDIYPRTNGEQLARWFLTFKVESANHNQLREKMAYFWHDLFAASRLVGSGREGHWGIEYLDLMRSDPFPNYRSFLIAITRNNLMLDWLDGHDNLAGAPNENYSRELWELFTLGETHPFTGLPMYSELDVQEAARALTGWERYDPANIAGNSTYSRFQPSRFDAGLKTVFGQTGPWNDVDIIDITLGRPEAAEYICYKLFRFFVHDQPDLPTIQILANQLRTGGWEIAPLVRTLLSSEAMFSPEALQAKVKTPTELLVGFSRQTGLRLPPNEVAERLEELGHEMGNPPSVKGWEEGIFLLGAAASSQRAQAINALAYSNFLSSANYLDRYLPPAGQRNSASTIQLVHDLLGVKPLVDGQVHHLIEYLDSVAAGPTAARRLWFDGDDPTHIDRKLRGLLYLVAIANSEYQLN